MRYIYLLDTNTFSDIATGRSPAARAEFARILHDPEARVAISVITEAEVRYGMEKRALSRKRRESLEGLFATLEILPWGSPEAATYGRIRAALSPLGLTIALMDLLIATHAVTSADVLVTRDGIFPRIAEGAGIPATVNWAKDLPEQTG